MFRTSTSFCAAQPHPFSFCGAKRRPVLNLFLCGAAAPVLVLRRAATLVLNLNLVLDLVLRRAAPPVLNLNLVLCGAAAPVLVLRRAAPPVLNLNLNLVLRRTAPPNLPQTGDTASAR